MGQWMRTADRRSAQSLTWLGRNCGSWLVEGGCGGCVFWMIALENVRRVCTFTDRNREQDLPGVFTESPKETVNTRASETNGPGSKPRSDPSLAECVALGKFIGLFKLQIPPLSKEDDSTYPVKLL